MCTTRSKAGRAPDTAAMYARALIVPLAALQLYACSTDGPSGDGAATAPTAFIGARLIVGDGSAALENSVFIVDGGRLAAVGPADETDVPPGAARVDLTGMTVIPAIVDTHTHLSRERDALIEDLQRRAYFGVGAALSLGQDAGEDVFAVRAQTVPGAARYRTAGRGVTSPEPGRSEIPYWVESEEEARAAVREQAALGVDIIKVWVDDRSGQYEKLSPELYAAVIDEAHAHGLRVTAHVFTLEDAKGLLRAGVDAFAHGIRDMDVDDEVIALFRERPHVVLVPNLPDRGVATDLSWLSDSLPSVQLAALQAASTDRPAAQAFFAVQARNLARLHAEGVPIALGTDGNNPWAVHLEMEDMVAAGMSPAAVVVAATRNSAQLVGLENAGTLEAGKSADFVVLEADPLENIRNTRRIRAVYLRGDAVDRGAVRGRWLSRSP